MNYDSEIIRLSMLNYTLGFWRVSPGEYTGTHCSSDVSPSSRFQELVIALYLPPEL